MTAPAFSPEIVAGARAMRDTKRKLIYERTYALGHGLGEEEIFQIDCQAFADDSEVYHRQIGKAAASFWNGDHITGGSTQHE